MRNSLLFFVLFAICPLIAEVKVLVFAGSTREGSYNKQLAHEAALIAREMGAIVTEIDLQKYPMPLYDADLEEKKGLPKNAKKFRNLMIESDVIVIASPEYNGSLTGVLKNAIDWASRDEAGSFSLEAFKGKTFALMSASPGGGGGARGLVHLESILQGLGGRVVSMQVVVPKAFEKGAIQSKKVKDELRTEMEEALSIDLAR